MGTVHAVKKKRFTSFFTGLGFAEVAVLVEWNTISFKTGLLARLRQMQRKSSRKSSKKLVCLVPSNL